MNTPQPNEIEPDEQRFVSLPDRGNTGVIAATSELKNAGFDYLRFTNVEGGTQIDAWHVKPVGSRIEAPFKEMAR